MKEVTKKELTKALKQKKPVVLVFSAIWCGPCQALLPILEKVSENYGELIQIYKVIVDKEPELTEAHNITAVPTILVFKNGVESKRLVGLVTFDDIIQIIM
jgi:thioredoxin 1